MRLCVALYPPPDALADLAAAWAPPAGVRPAPVEQWHLTLAFLGEVRDDTPVQSGLREVADRHQPLRLRLAGGGTFARQGVVWAGLDGDLEALRRLAADVQEACRAAGTSLPDKPFRAHLTLGRARTRAPVDAAALASYAGPEWEADRVVLVRSVLGRGPARHSERASWPLSPRAGG